MTQEALKELEELVGRYGELIEAELSERITAWHPKFEEREMYQAIGGLLARQVTLAVELANSPPAWNGHFAPLVLRSMVDGYITLSWIFQDPLERSRKFILYGLGQEKLNLEHRRNQLKKQGVDPDEDEGVKIKEMWINSQQFTFLTEVNVGSWSGKTPREMAEEAGCIDLYNFAYNPFSSATHNMWPHIDAYNLEPCTNPLHGGHKIAGIRKAPWDVDYLYRAAKYARKSFHLFDQKTGIKPSSPSAFDFLCEWLKGKSKGESSEAIR